MDARAGAMDGRYENVIKSFDRICGEKICGKAAVSGNGAGRTGGGILPVHAGGSGADAVFLRHDASAGCGGV